MESRSSSSGVEDVVRKNLKKMETSWEAVNKEALI